VPGLSGTIDRLGAMADVRVMLSHQRVEALKKAGRPYATPQTVLGLIDTGASCSAIDATLARGMGLEPRGVTQIHTPSTGDAYETRNLYDVSFVLGHDQPAALHLTLSVIESGFASEGFLVLIGRDVLSRCTFTYHGPTGRYSLDW
jgi:hypothetical protein